MWSVVLSLARRNGWPGVTWGAGPPLAEAVETNQLRHELVETCPDFGGVGFF